MPGDGSSPPRARFSLDPRVLEGAFLDSLRAALSGSSRAIPRVLVVAPTQRLLDRLAWRATRDLGALAGVRFLTHHALAEQLLAGEGSRVASVLEAPWLARLLAARLAAEGDAPGGLAAQPAAIPALVATLRDLRDAGVDAERALAARGISATARRTAAALRTFEALLRDLDAIGLGDAADAPRRAARAAPPAGAADALLHYGAYDLIGVHRDLMSALARRIPTEWFVPAPADSPIARRLLPGSDERGLARLAPGSGAGADEGAAAAAVWSTAGPREEMRFALRRLLQWHREDGVALDEMAILVRSPGPYAAALAAEEAVLELAADASLRAPVIEGPSFARLALVLRAWREPRARRAAARGRLFAAEEWAALEPIAASFAGAGTLRARCELLLPFAESCDDPALAEILRGAIARGTRLERGGLLGAESAADSIDLLLALLESTPRRPERGSVGSLRVLDFHQARGLPWRRAILAGMNEHLVPRRAPEDSFLPDADRERIAAATGRRLPLASDAPAEEELLFAVIRGAVSERLEATWARTDGEREQSPSPWLARLAGGSARPALVVARHPTLEVRSLLDETGLLRTEEALALAGASDAAAAAELADRIAGERAAHLRDCAAMVAAIDRYEPAAGSPLPFDGAGIGLAPIDRISASQLIALAGCPLQYLFAAGLGLEEAPDLPGLGELDARRLGTLFHLALRRLYERIVPRGAPPVPDAARQAAALLPELLAAALREVDPQRDLPDWLAPARIARWTRRLAEFVADDLRAIVERGLLGGDYELKVVLPFPHGERTIEIRGCIDRILRDAGGAEWIGDYKSGGADSLRGRASLKAVLRGAALQLPIYALARAESAGASVSGLELLALKPARRGGGERSVPLDVAKLCAREGELRALLTALLAQRESGSFPLNPDDDLDHGRCGTCAFRRACRHSHGPTVERVAAAAASEPWLRAISAADSDPADAADPGPEPP